MRVSPLRRRDGEVYLFAANSSIPLSEYGDKRYCLTAECIYTSLGHGTVVHWKDASHFVLPKRVSIAIIGVWRDFYGYISERAMRYIKLYVLYVYMKGKNKYPYAHCAVDFPFKAISRPKIASMTTCGEQQQV
jgi:hypothetical protein